MATQGHTLPVLLRTDEPATLSVTLLERARSVFPIADDTWRALVGVAIRTPAGPARLVVTATDQAGNRATVETEVQVEGVDWPFTGPLPMSRAAARVEPEGIVRMRAERDAVYRTSTPRPLWSGPLQVPVEGGTHTSPYGSFREYPDGSRSYHDAEDIARRRGVPVHAAGSGTVALARSQSLHGNAVLLNHGQKVVTLYSHLDRVDVTEGQAVVPGTLLGSMGSTGRTTGPHLHWGIVVDEVAVDPMEWTTDDFGLRDAEDWVLLAAPSQ